MTIGIMYFVNLHHKDAIVDDRFVVNKHRNIKVNVSHMEKAFIIHNPFIIWLIIAFKRIDEKDDKADNFSSYFKNEFKIRGGEKWDKQAYLQSYVNIDLSF